MKLISPTEYAGNGPGILTRLYGAMSGGGIRGFLDPNWQQTDMANEYNALAMDDLRAKAQERRNAQARGESVLRMLNNPEEVDTSQGLPWQTGQAPQMRMNPMAAEVQKVPGLLAFMQNASPQAASGILDMIMTAKAEQAAAGPAGPIKLGAGDVLLDPNTQQPIFQAPFAPREPKQANAEAVIDVETGKPTYVTDADLLANPGRYQPINRGLNVTLPDGTSISEGMMGPEASTATSSSTATQVQKDLESLEQSAGRISNITERYKPEFLTYAGGVDAWKTRVQEKTGGLFGTPDEQQKQFLRDRTKFTQGVQREFNEYRRQITGAAAAVAELNDLMKATINLDQSPTEFEASLELYQEELGRAMRIKRRLLREGIPTTSREFGRRMDEMFLNGGDDAFEQRFEELTKQGMNKEQAFGRLRMEGYNVR